MKLQSIGLVALAVAAASCFQTPAYAQSAPEAITDAITNAFFNQSGDLYRNRGIDRQATLLFGLSFPENEYTNDAQQIEKIYQAGQFIQGGNGFAISTADLPNPFTSSLRTAPAQTKSIDGSENKYTEVAPTQAPAPRGRW